MKTIILTFIIGVLGYIMGISQSQKLIEKLNNRFRKPTQLPDSYDEFKDNIEESVNLGNVLDICFRYGFNERDKIEQDNIDKMLMELSGETETKQ